MRGRGWRRRRARWWRRGRGRRRRRARWWRRGRRRRRARRRRGGRRRAGRRMPFHVMDTFPHCTVLGSSGSGGQSPRPVVPPMPLSRQGGGGGGGGLLARNTGSHCGGTPATELAKMGWLASANLRGGGGGESNGGKSGCAKAHTWSSWLRESPALSTCMLPQPVWQKARCTCSWCVTGSFASRDKVVIEKLFRISQHSNNSLSGKSSQRQEGRECR